MKPGKIFSLFLLLVFCCSCSKQAEKPGEKVVRFPAEDWGYPSPFAFYPAGPGYLRMSMIFDTLVWKDENGIIPWLAKDWVISDDGKTWRFYLRNDVKFQDGKPLSAEDAAFSYMYMKKHPFPWADLSVIDSAQAESRLVVVIKLKDRFAPFLEEIIGVVPIIPERIWSNVEEPRKFQDKSALAGTGPFILEKYESEHGVYIYRANPDYFMGRPRVDRLAWVPCGDPVLGLAKGEIDAHTLWWQTVDAVDRFRNDSRYRIMEGASDWILKLIFNTRKPLLDDSRVRQAFAYAIDRVELCTRIKHNHAIAGNPGIIPDSSPWYNPDVPKYEFSIEKANGLLDEAGFRERGPDGIRKDKRGRSLSFELTFGAEYSREAEFIASSMAKVGVKVKSKVLDFKTIFTLMEGEWDKFDLALNGHGGVAGDLDLLRRWFGKQIGNSGFWQDNGFNKLSEEQMKILDPKERMNLAGQMQRILADQLPVLVLYHPRIYFVYRPDVYNHWFFTKGGIAIGIPMTLNKLAFLERNEVRNR